MPGVRDPKKVASSYSTGGGGADFERRVFAYYLSTLLIGATPRGLDGGTTRYVEFQRLYAGEPMDDVVITAELPAGDAKLALQLKRDLAFGESNKEFDDVMHAAWLTFTSPRFRRDVDQFGIVLALTSKTVEEHYQTVLKSARNSPNARDFLDRARQPGLTSQEQRNFVELVRAKLVSFAPGVLTDDDLWEFLKSMLILRFDVQNEGSSDYANTLHMLTAALPPSTPTAAPALLDALGDLASDSALVAGAFDSASLTRALLKKGIQLVTPATASQDLRHLEEHSQLVLSGIRNDIAGIEIDRSDLVTSAKEELRRSSLLELVGPPGVGKSAILKALAQERAAVSSTVVLSGDRLSGSGWDEFARARGLALPLSDLVLALSSRPDPILFIDGIDRVEETGVRNVLNDLIRALDAAPPNVDGSRRWKIVATLREENLQEVHSWLQWDRAGRPTRLAVPELGDSELALVAERSPYLRQVIGLGELAPIVRLPFMLDLIERDRLVSGEGRRLTTEIDVSVAWWEHVVDRGSSLGVARRLALLKVGREAAAAPGRLIVVQDVPPDALRSLETDQILVRESGRDVHRFRHDLLEDWILYRVLDQRRDDVLAYIIDLGQPFGLLRAVQLLALFILEREPTATAWQRLVEEAELREGLAPKWRHALLTAPLMSPRSEEILAKVAPFLDADDGRRLDKLMIALYTTQVSPNLGLMSSAAVLSPDPSERLSIALQHPIPRWRVWANFLSWLLPRLSGLDRSHRKHALRLMEIWQAASPPRTPFREEIARIALSWLREVERWEIDESE